MPKAFYSVSKHKTDTIIRARDSHAKQVLFGWAGAGGPSMELYGYGTGLGAGDNELWEWRLSPAGVRELLRGVQQQHFDPKRWGVSEEEHKRAKELLAKLYKLGGRSTGGGKRRKATTVGPREAAAFVRKPRIGAMVRFIDHEFGDVPKSGTVVDTRAPGWFGVRTSSGSVREVHINAVLNVFKGKASGGGKKRKGRGRTGDGIKTPRLFRCTVCSHEQIINAATTDDAMAYCNKCSWKMLQFHGAKNRSEAEREFRYEGSPGGKRRKASAKKRHASKPKRGLGKELAAVNALLRR